MVTYFILMFACDKIQFKYQGLPEPIDSVS